MYLIGPINNLNMILITTAMDLWDYDYRYVLINSLDRALMVPMKMYLDLGASGSTTIYEVHTLEASSSTITVPGSQKIFLLACLGAG